MKPDTTIHVLSKDRPDYFEAAKWLVRREIEGRTAIEVVEGTHVITYAASTPTVIP